MFEVGSVPTMYSKVSFSGVFFSPLNGIDFEGRPAGPVFSVPPYTEASLMIVSGGLCLVRRLPRLDAGVFVVLLFFKR